MSQVGGRALCPAAQGFGEQRRRPRPPRRLPRRAPGRGGRVARSRRRRLCTFADLIASASDFRSEALGGGEGGAAGDDGANDLEAVPLGEVAEDVVVGHQASATRAGWRRALSDPGVELLDLRPDRSRRAVRTAAASMPSTCVTTAPRSASTAMAMRPGSRPEVGSVPRGLVGGEADRIDALPHGQCGHAGLLGGLDVAQHALLQAEAVVDDQVGVARSARPAGRRRRRSAGLSSGFISTVTSAWSPTMVCVTSPRMFVVTTTWGRFRRSLAHPAIVTKAIAVMSRAMQRVSSAGLRHVRGCEVRA